MLPVSFTTFEQLSDRVQLTMVLLQGTYLATRVDADGTRFRLYALHRFFAEVY